MSSQSKIEINGRTLVSIKEAAKSVSYSRDYVARLAREQKISASQIGRQWFVDLVSLQSFAKSIELEQKVRKQNLSHERKRERIAKQELETLHLSEEKIKNNSNSQALVLASLVITFGLFSGVALHNFSSLQISLVSNIDHIGIAASYPSVESVDVLPEVVEQVSSLNTTVMEYPLFIDEQEVRIMKKDSEGIFLLADEGEIGNESEVRALFSDDVSVEFVGGNDGVITLEKEVGEVVEYPFVSVPAKTGLKEVSVNESPI